MSEGKSFDTPPDHQVVPIEQITTRKLNGSNYVLWAKSVGVYLKGLGRYNHVTDSAPKNDAEKLEIWEQHDNQIMTELWNAMEPNIADMCWHKNSAKELWEHVRLLFSNNVTRTYDLYVELFKCKQGEKSPAKYFSEVKNLFEEHLVVRPVVTDAKEIMKQREELFVMRYLAGLSPEYEPLRTQILGGTELPSLAEVYSRVSGALPTQNSGNDESESGERGNRKRFRGGRGGPDRGSQRTCDHCDKEGHMSDEEEEKPKSECQPKGSSHVLPSSILAPPPSCAPAPCRDDSRVSYPPLRFEGTIVYSRTDDEVQKAASELLEILEVKKREGDVFAIGFDIEWKPSFRKGVMPGKAAVMQICFDPSVCHVMHIIHSGLPRSLRCLLQDPLLLKVGVGIDGDRVKMRQDHNICIKPVKDISCLANRKLGETRQCWGLKSLTEILVCKTLQKRKKIRLGNWQVQTLSQGQLEYASTDAFASWHLYQVLMGLPDAKKRGEKHSRDVWSEDKLSFPMK